MDNVKFTYTTKIVQQLDFEKRGHNVEVVVGECHILYLGSILCGLDKEKMKDKLKTKTVKTVQTRPQGIKVCEACEKKYKANSNLPWSKWVVASLPDLHGVKSQESI